MIFNGHTIDGLSSDLLEALGSAFKSASNEEEDRAATSLLRFTWTFDDCHKDLTAIDQVIRGHFGITFRFFVSPFLIDSCSSGSAQFVRNQLRDENASLLSWDEIGSLVEKGHLIGLHGYDHSDFSVMSDSQIVEQHERSIDLLRNRLGLSTDSFAFPFGRLRGGIQIFQNSEITITKKYFSRLYLSDNRLPVFNIHNVFNRRHAEFGSSVFTSVIKGFLQFRFSRRLNNLL